MTTASTRSARTGTSTVDGTIRNRQVDPSKLPAGWESRKHGYVPPVELDLDPSLTLHEDYERDVDPVTYQVLRSRFWNLNLDHSDTIKRMSGSPLIVYMDDFNTSLLTENGDSVVCGPSIQYFTGHGDLVVKWTLENRSGNPGIEDGDVFLQNDPYIGTNHQMDVAIYTPVFWDGKLFSWVMGMCHVGDIGGMDPGSFCINAPDMFHEPQPMPPIKLVRKGVMQRDIADMFVRQSRTPDMIALQIRSQIAGLRTTKDRMLEMLRDYDPTVVKGVMRRMIRDASQAVERRLADIPDGEWSETIYLGSAGPGDRDVHRLTTRLRKVGDRLIFDNVGSDPQFFAANATFSAWRSGIVCAGSTLLGFDQLYCPAGVADHMEFEPVPGKINCAEFPGAVTPVTGPVVGVYVASQVISKMLLSAEGEVRETANAAGGVSLPGWWVCFGLDRNGNFVADLTGDSLNGSIGAFPSRDGVDTGGAWWWPRSRAGNVEEWESALPIMYLYRREQIDSGGAGRWRGGNGAEIAVMPHKSSNFAVQIISSDPAINTTPGLAGGMPGHPGNHRLAHNTDLRDQMMKGAMAGDRVALEELIGPIERLSPKATTGVTNDDVLCVDYSAGGGYGDVLRRPAELVAADVVGHQITAAQARSVYGVVLDVNGDPDAEETAKARQSLRDERLARAVAPSGGGPDPVPIGDVVAVGDALGVTFIGEASHWACTDCGGVMGSTAENYKSGSAVIEENPHDIDPLRYPNPADFCDVPFVLRQYLCPSCATVLSVECAKQSEPPTQDVSFSPVGLQQLRDRLEARHATS
jgi:N-methylhydantoinase B